MIFGSGGLESRLAKFIFTPIRTATKRASGGKAANNNTAGRRLGPKKGEGEFVEPGQIIWRQRGTKWYPGENAGIGRDHTIFAKEPGYVRYYRDPFHAKRRFIGIALGTSDRLPTPHFDPRKRRFGFTPIDNEEIAEFELNFMTRKETSRMIKRTQNLVERNANQKSRTEQYATVLSGAGMKDPIGEDQLNRLDLIYQFMCGGMQYTEAKKTVDEQAMEDFDLHLRVGRFSPEDHKAQVAAYSEAAGQIDAAAAFGPNRKLAAISELDAKSREDAINRISELTQAHQDSVAGTPENVVKEVFAILESTPSFSPSDVAHLKSKFLRRPSPSLVSKENKAAFEKQVKKGEGELRNVWDEQSRSSQQYFIPSNGKLIF